ncbi:DUF1398 domain-containing protein [Mycolicibacterium rhodesiae]|uniref:DUF1398 domain-containing protein n=1 Tax=Mycolicibacterium rhodesiae TaxID=36814 RepID=A0A1X0IIB3_MYCRH|nr:DUF1398 family protein [Mycolicibacterium rhodesiae]MCV7347874.1 DUF1398 family protein [Mycolicibacterium rhodesiae]ORB47246.1 DUF1398 domain-containing protein [Mycolicibacterium rhodesiae]
MLAASPAMTNVDSALRSAAANRPATQGFPHLAETLRRAGVRTNTWWLPSMQSVYDTELGCVVVQSPALFDGMADVPDFDRAALIEALRTDQAGQTTFPQFALAAWRAGVLRWVVDLDHRTCTYFGSGDQVYVEQYAAVELSVT